MSSLASQRLFATTKKELEWYSHHPSLERVTIHVRQMDDNSAEPVGAAQSDVAVSAVPGLAAALATVTALLCLHVTDDSGLPCVAQPVPVPESVEPEPEPE